MNGAKPSFGVQSPLARYTAPPRMSGLTHRSIPDKIPALIIVGGVMVTPLVVDLRSVDPFRVPQEAAFTATAILSAAALLIAWLRGANDRAPLAQSAAVFRCLLVIAGWTLVSTTLSVNPLVSWPAFGVILGAAAIFLVILATGAHLPLAAAAAVLVPAVVNATVLILQISRVWNFYDPTGAIAATGGARATWTTLLGNVDVFGMQMVCSVIVAAGLAIATKGWTRWTAASVAAYLMVATLLSQTLSSVAAIAVAVIVMFIAAWPTLGRRERIAVVLGLLFMLGSLGIAGGIYPPFRTRVRERLALFTAGDVDVASSGRLTPARAAWRLFLRHPLFGVGPGGFKFLYFDVKKELAREYESAGWQQGSNFGQVHNDHLQTLAETGAPGYLIFLAANALVISAAVPARSADARARFVRVLAPGIVAAFLVSALAQFPMEIGATRISYLFLYGLCCAWSRP